MAKFERFTEVKYPGVYYINGTAVGSGKPDKIFYIRYRKDGRAIEEKVGRASQNNMTFSKASRIRLNRIEGRQSTNTERREAEEAAKQAEEGRYTIAKLWTAYKEAKPNLKGIVTDQNRFDLYLDPAFGKKEPAELVPLDVDRLRLKLLKTKSPATVRNVLELLRRLINYGVNKQLCEGAGFRIEMPKVNNIKTEDLSPDQLKKLLEVIEMDTHKQAGPIMLMALYTGMRRGELFKLEWRDIDFERGFIKIRDPKGVVDQTIPLNDAAAAVLNNHPKMKGSPFVFPGRGGRQRTDINKAVAKIKKAAGLPSSFRALHGLRHVYASMLASSGQVDLYTLQKLMTHKSPLMTQRYAHLRDEALKSASQLAGDIVNNIVTKKKNKTRKIV
ncbi:tyrosine-type recombinase/integrase [Desulfosarcina ovata]|uniref:Integrase n=1 Tax=Desulfosarcina ovata subsp. ovata TaxID=2752305 RepID=A0A5K8AHV6_9BACT|nr:site-specific integrase [Desulfosarcina ovata]BBO92069.1 integrase [Desulfosarcina ovata subsp. ovata]